jgi:hypothetical protein
MKTRESTIREYLSDPTMVERGYLAEGEADKIEINAATNSKMVDLIVKIVNGKFDENSDNQITREVNKLLNTTDSK